MWQLLRNREASCLGTQVEERLQDIWISSSTGLAEVMIHLDKHTLVLSPKFQERCGLVEKNLKENNNVIKELENTTYQERLNELGVF